MEVNNCFSSFAPRIVSKIKTFPIYTKPMNNPSNIEFYLAKTQQERCLLAHIPHPLCFANYCSTCRYPSLSSQSECMRNTVYVLVIDIF